MLIMVLEWWNLSCLTMRRMVRRNNQGIVRICEVSARHGLFYVVEMVAIDGVAMCVLVLSIDSNVLYGFCENVMTHASG